MGFYFWDLSDLGIWFNAPTHIAFVSWAVFFLCFDVDTIFRVYYSIRVNLAYECRFIHSSVGWVVNVLDGVSLDADKDLLCFLSGALDVELKE